MLQHWSVRDILIALSKDSKVSEATQARIAVMLRWIKIRESDLLTNTFEEVAEAWHITLPAILGLQGHCTNGVVTSWGYYAKPTGMLELCIKLASEAKRLKVKKVKREP